MNTVNVNNPNEFKNYPTHRLCAVVDEELRARNVLDLLLRSGIEESNIDIFHGEKGIMILDADGEHHGPLAKLKNQLRAYGDAENEAMHIYEKAMYEGSYVFEVLADTAEQKEAVYRTFVNNGAWAINYFGSWYVEALKEA